MKKLVVILVLATLLLSSTTAGWAQQPTGPQPGRLPRHASGQTVRPGRAPDELNTGSRGAMQAQVAKLTAADGGAGDLFGETVSIWVDTAIVGAPRADVGGNLNQGAAYVFYRDQGGPDAWGLVSKLTVSDGASGDELGKAVSVDGDTAVVSAVHAQSGGNADQGVAYVFYRNQGGPDAWGQVAKLTSADGAPNDEFGWDVAVSGDTAVVSAMAADVLDPDQGAAYVFYRNQGGPDAWGQVAKLIDPDAVSYGQYGWDVSVSGDTAVVGEPSALVGDHPWQGAILVYERNFGGPDAWGQAAKLTAADGAAGDWLGDGAAVDGDTILGGADAAHVAGHNDQGAAYIFYRNEGGPGAWGQVAKLTAADGEVADYFGSYLSLSGDVAFVPASWANVGGHVDQGAAYSFYRNQGGPDAWGQTVKLVAADGAASDELGSWSAVSGGTALAGAWQADVGGNADQGAAYVFALPALHVAGIEGHFSFDPYGRTLLRARVAVHDEMGNPAGDVAVDASIWSPAGGPYARTRLTKAGGWATFPWGSNVAGTWQLCVDALTKDGYLYAPGENDVPACASWNN